MSATVSPLVTATAITEISSAGVAAHDRPAEHDAGGGVAHDLHEAAGVALDEGLRATPRTAPS